MHTQTQEYSTMKIGHTLMLPIVLLCSLGLSGCITRLHPNVVVYPKDHQDAVQIARDKADCRAWAEEEAGLGPSREVAADVGMNTAVGALGGAAAGAIIGAAAGAPGTGAAVGAAVGGVGGAGIAGAHHYLLSYDGYNRAYAACMQTRNYLVN